MKTTFGHAVVVTSKWLNGAKKLYFDGQDLDWHFDPLGLESLVTKGSNGLDTRYVTLGTSQPNLAPNGTFISGSPISGSKVVTGLWSFGFDPAQNPTVDAQNGVNAPRSYLTNIKYNYANGINPSSISQKFASLSDSDLMTKRIVLDQFDNLVVDNGIY